MTIEIMAPSHASRLNPETIKMMAAKSVDAEIMESSFASSPEATRESELTSFPTFLT